MAPLLARVCERQRVRPCASSKFTNFRETKNKIRRLCPSPLVIFFIRPCHAPSGSSLSCPSRYRPSHRRLASCARLSWAPKLRRLGGGVPVSRVTRPLGPEPSRVSPERAIGLKNSKQSGKKHSLTHSLAGGWLKEE